MSSVQDKLDFTEVRVLGALVEKEITTPEYYPLTLNALVAACNQKTNRDPVTSFDEPTVEAALESLRQKGLATVRTGAGLRVPKHGHRLAESINLGRREVALLCILMLRGPQTVGELRDRTERMHSFADLEEVEACLARLMEWQPEPLAARLPRQPGTKEPRYAHLLSGEVSTVAGASEPAQAARPSYEQRLAALEAEIERLKLEFAEFRKQFE
jgi:uncharacterized protein